MKLPPLLALPLVPFLAGRPASTPATPATPAASVTIEDAAWLAGSWEGEFLGGFAEETWSEPSDGAMMGMFRHLKDDSVAFYEFFTLVEDDEHGLALRLKHFHPDLRGWEEKDRFVEFPLVTIGEDELVFDGLAMRLEDDVIQVELNLGRSDRGSPRAPRARGSGSRAG